MIQAKRQEHHEAKRERALSEFKAPLDISEVLTGVWGAEGLGLFTCQEFWHSIKILC